MATDPEIKHLIEKFVGGSFLHEALWQFQKTRQFTDLTLSCSDGTVPAHLAMLAGVFKLLGIETEIFGLEEVKCLVIPDVAVSEVEQALEELYLKAEPEKLLNLLCHKNVKSEMVDIVNVDVEVTPEVNIYEENVANYPMMEYLDDCGIKQELPEFSTHSFPIKKNFRGNLKNPSDPLYLLKNKDPEKCQFCGKMFPRVSHLNRHVKDVHGDDRPYQCIICEFRSKRKDYLKEHMKVHNAVKEHSCEKCGFKTNRTRELRYHKCRTKVFSCEICDKRSVSLEALRKHKKRFHPQLKKEPIYSNI